MVGMPLEPEYIEFDTIRERWSKYKLEDGTIIKIKFVPIKFAREKIDDAGNPVYLANYTNVVGSVPPSNLLGSPSSKKYGRQEIIDAIVEEDMRFETLEEDWNEYQLKDGSKLSVKAVVTKVDKTNLFDEKGEPLYNVSHQVLMKGSIPKELRKKLRDMAEKTRL